MRSRKLADRTYNIADAVIRLNPDFSNSEDVKKKIDEVIEPILDKNGFILDPSEVGFRDIDSLGYTQSYFHGGRPDPFFKYRLYLHSDIPVEYRKEIIYHEIVHIAQAINTVIKNKERIQNEYKFTWGSIDHIVSEKEYRSYTDKKKKENQRKKLREKYQDEDADYYMDQQEIDAHAYELASRLVEEAKKKNVDPKAILTKEEASKIMPGVSVEFYFDKAPQEIKNKFLKKVYEGIAKESSLKIAKDGVVYDFSNTQIILNDTINNKILDFINNEIDEEDLDGDGKENAPHITVLYGIAEQEPDDRMEKAISEIGGLKTVDFQGLGKFTPDNQDVLLIKISPKGIKDLFNAMVELYPEVELTFPEYKPHLTLAYLKPGMADKYIEKFPDIFKDRGVQVKAFEFSSKTTEKFQFKTGSISKVSYVQYVKGHKNSKGESAPWVIKQHETGKILSSHKTKSEAQKHLKQMEMHKHMGNLKKTGSFAEDIYIVLYKNKKKIQSAVKNGIDISVMMSSIFDNIIDEFPVDLNSITFDVDGLIPEIADNIFVCGAQINVETKDLHVSIDPSHILDITNFNGWNIFMNEIEDSISHEIQHQEDFSTGKITEEDFPEPDNEDVIEYYASPAEMNAFSRQAISQFRNQGLTDEDIIELLDKNPAGLSGESWVFDKYYFWFKDHDPEVYEDFIKLLKRHLTLDKEKFKAAADEQEYSSADTSLNQIPELFRKISWQPDTINIDYGGGKFNKATEYLAERGVENLVFDPFNRSQEYNSMVKDRLSTEKADTGTLANVLNVIKEENVRLNVLRDLKSMVKPGGSVYISVYYSPGKTPGLTTKGWQNHKPIKEYLSEVQSVFSSAIVTKNMIVASV